MFINKNLEFVPWYILPPPPPKGEIKPAKILFFSTLLN